MPDQPATIDDPGADASGGAGVVPPRRVGQALAGQWDQTWRSHGGTVAVLAVVAVVGAVVWWATRPALQAGTPVEERLPIAAGSRPSVTVPARAGGSANPPGATEGAEVPAPRGVTVHVTGAVQRPGVYRLDGGSRVVDAIAAAGGVGAAAELDRLNLAAPLTDGSQIWVPGRGQEQPVIVGPVAPASAVAPTGSAAGVVRVPLNTADAAALEQLPGIGPALAAAIVAYRDEHGPFAAVEDLLEVPGIGPAKLADLEGAVVI